MVTNLSEKNYYELMLEVNVQSLFVMLPTLDEEKALANVFNRIPFSRLSKMGYDCRVVVVDGGSEDNTVKIAREYDCEVIEQWGEGKAVSYTHLTLPTNREV